MSPFALDLNFHIAVEQHLVQLGQHAEVVLYLGLFFFVLYNLPIHLSMRNQKRNLQEEGEGGCVFNNENKRSVL